MLSGWDRLTPVITAAAVMAGQAGSATGAPEEGPLLRLEHVSKSFGPVEALRDINLDIYPGQVTALVGDNGAGKSTMIKTISGIWPPDAGQIYWAGRPTHIGSPRAASALGIATMYQDLALADNLDIVNNIFLGRERLKRGLLDEAAMEIAARRTLHDLRVSTVRSVRQPVGSLSGGQRQAVAVARAVLEDAKLVIMDEPTAALGVSQTAMVLDLVRRLSDQGVAVLLISHNLVDVFAVADQIAVLYLGHVAAVRPTADLDTQHVVELITTGEGVQ
ncbi:MAG: D-xylose transport system ATP-binding protein [Pseudonocardiales bacterium]|nr:D-xylose transport system ATP-binding protein [Pseudonocardiales bacterium]MDT4941699.1 D-xylose transport system ATP-binding protein [Pseudonocardiales bacterium]